MKLKFTLLIDDKPGKNLLNEHGLSIFIETGELSILFDTGQSGRFLSNAEKFGVKLGKTDFAVISHGHYDHGGGLPDFLSQNLNAPVYIHSASALPVYYSTRKKGEPRYVGINENIFTDYKKRFKFIDSVTTPAHGVHIIPATEIKNRGPIFNDNSLFIRTHEGNSIETFDHEIFLILERDSDIVVVSGCSHNNILSIIDHTRKMFPQKKISCVIGGFHLPEIENFSTGHREAIINTSEELSRYTGIKFITGHCTGDSAKLILKKRLGENIDFFYTGYSIIL